MRGLVDSSFRLKGEPMRGMDCFRQDAGYGTITERAAGLSILPRRPVFAFYLPDQQKVVNKKHVPCDKK